MQLYSSSCRMCTNELPPDGAFKMPLKEDRETRRATILPRLSGWPDTPLPPSWQSTVFTLLHGVEGRKLVHFHYVSLGFLSSFKAVVRGLA